MSSFHDYFASSHFSGCKEGGKAWEARTMQQSRPPLRSHGSAKVLTFAVAACLELQARILPAGFQQEKFRCVKNFVKLA